MTHRPNIDFSEINTGKSWLGCDALLLGLIDDVKHSDAYLQEVMKRALLFRVKRNSNIGKSRSIFGRFNAAVVSPKNIYPEIRVFFRELLAEFKNSHASVVSFN